MSEAFEFHIDRFNVNAMLSVKFQGITGRFGIIKNQENQAKLWVKWNKYKISITLWGNGVIILKEKDKGVGVVKCGRGWRSPTSFKVNTHSQKV